MKLKKSLGQNFLHNLSVIKKIVDSAHLQGDEVVLEIGPGSGALTREILLRGHRVVAVETDIRMVELLQKSFSKEIETKQLVIIHADILESDIKNLLPEGYHVVANIPYYITGAIMRHLLTQEYQPKTMTLIMQKEVAQRITQTDGKASLLSNSVKVYGKPQIKGVIKKGAFTPPPKVDSSILYVGGISKKLFKEYDLQEENFFTVLKAGFSHKRKQIKSNMRDELDWAPEDIHILEELLIERGFSSRARAEELSTSDWIAITKAFSYRFHI